ncbi:MAG: glycosyltransferase family 39 protein [Gemmatimonadota bacterium]|nr:glycosyltransferase family 39 protein [Gemmatimonadota bacterium]
MRGPLRWSLLAAAVAVAAGLVAWAFNPAPHSGGDNAAYLALADALANGRGYVDAYDPADQPHTKYPPLFPALLAGFALLGAATWPVFKGVVAVATVLMVGFSFVWAERRLGPWSAFAVAVLVAAAPAVVYYSHWILSDPVFVLLILVSLWALETGEARSWHRGWIALGLGAALAAYFTRSAGLPLLIAVLGWLALRRRFRTLAVAAAVFVLPAVAWWIRGRGEGVGDYVSEFWMVDPYQPGLGTVGVAGLAGRAVGNAVTYVTGHLPDAVVGAQGAWTMALGIGLVVAVAWGWGAKIRKAPGAAELFLPLYVALILVWPEVWGGDRFVLPVLPLCLVYGTVALQGWTRRMGGGARVVAAAALVLLLLPALGSWLGTVRDARACASAAATSGPFACYGEGVAEFAGAAEWMGRTLPEGSAVMTRKPRIFYVMSGGVPSRTFPFDGDPDVQLDEADAVGARYVLLDRWDVQASRFVGAAVRSRPGAFCFVRDFGAGSGGGAQLLGILPKDERGSGDVSRDGSVSIPRCPGSYVVEGADDGGHAPATSSLIPLFSRSPR